MRKCNVGLTKLQPVSYPLLGWNGLKERGCDTLSPPVVGCCRPEKTKTLALCSWGESWSCWQLGQWVFIWRVSVWHLSGLIPTRNFGVFWVLLGHRSQGPAACRKSRLCSHDVWAIPQLQAWKRPPGCLFRRERSPISRREESVE